MSEGTVLGEVASAVKSVPGAVKAIARLVAGTADAGAAWIDVVKAKGEQVASSIRSDTDSAKALSEAISQTYPIAVGQDQQLQQRAIAAYSSDAIRKQANIEGVARAAIEEMEADPPPPDAASPTDDWMNKFQRYAEDASSDGLQSMWGKILAQEIRIQGSISFATMRTISELDYETAKAFDRLKDYAIHDYIPFYNHLKLEQKTSINLSTRNLILSEVNYTAKTFTKVKLENEGFYNAVPFDEYRLIIPHIESGYSISADHKDLISQSGGNYYLKGYFLTKNGKEIMDTINNNSEENIKKLARHLSTITGQNVSLFRISGDELEEIEI